MKIWEKRDEPIRNTDFFAVFSFPKCSASLVDPEAGGGNTLQFVFVNSECLFVSTLDFTVAQGCTAKQTFGVSLLSAVVLFGETRGSAGW